jgi:hypothetical protein
MLLKKGYIWWHFENGYHLEFLSILIIASIYLTTINQLLLRLALTASMLFI